MLLSSTTFSTLHNGLHWNNNIPSDKHIIKQHILNGGLKIELTEEYLLPIYYFAPFEENIPDRTNVENALSAIAFQMRDAHIDIFISLGSFVKTLKKHGKEGRETDEDIVIDMLKMKHSYSQEKNGAFYYKTLYLEELQKHIPRVVEIVTEFNKKHPNYNELHSLRDLVEEGKMRTHGQIPQRLHPKEYFIKPYTSNDDWIFDIFSKVYKTAKASVRDSFCFTPVLYGFDYAVNNEGQIEISFKKNHINKKYTKVQKEKLTKALNEDLQAEAAKYETIRKEKGHSELEFYTHLHEELSYKFGDYFYLTKYYKGTLELMQASEKE